MGLLLNPLHAIALVVLALAIGGGLGYCTGSDHEREKQEAAIAKQLIETRKSDVAAVSDAQAKSEAVTAQIEESREVASQITTQVRKNFQRQTTKRTVVHKPTNAERGIPDDQDPVPVKRIEVETAVIRGRDLLDAVTACLLDNARRNRTPDCPSSGGDGESETPSDVTFEEFATNDVEVARMYHELAERHNALVDYVRWLQEQQQKRLGILEQE